MNRLSVLLVEDDDSIRESLVGHLEEEEDGWEVDVARTCAEARVAFSAQMPDIILLDWKLPDGQGIDLLKEWRMAGSKIPILMLTARVELIDKVLGLELGANDYMTKPFALRELIARIRVQARLLQERPIEFATPSLSSGDVTLCPLSHEVHYKGDALSLTKKEYQLLRLFLEHRGQVFTRDELLDRVWGYEQFPETRTIDTHVMQLRQKLSRDCIETIRGIGYRWREQA